MLLTLLVGSFLVVSASQAPVCSDDKSMCTACAECCHSYIPSGIPCSTCVTEKCNPPRPPARLTVNGSTLLDPAGKTIRLTGFNWQLGRTAPNEGDVMRQVMPGANVARLVGVLWDNNDPPNHPSSDCMTNEPPHYFNDACFDTLDPWVKTATDNGIWVVLAVRAQVGAGQYYDTRPGTVVFRNSTLKMMFYAMWSHVADHYASFDRIAAYEILSEPRDKSISQDVVRDFYEGGCAVTRTADPRTPCMVGGAPYYNLWNFNANTVLRNTSNVIYTFDYFLPQDFVFGKSTVPQYNASYECKDLCQGWVTQACPNGQGDARVRLDRSWSETQFANFALPIKKQFNVPIFMNQWEAVHGVTA
eukprot:gene9214-24024_t